jgi:hypothetical protein
VTTAINLPFDITGGKRVQLISDDQLVEKGLTPRKSNPCTGLDRPFGLQEVDAPRISTQRHMKMASLSAPRTGRLYFPREISGTHFCYRPSRPHGHTAAGRIRPMKNPNYSTGNRTHDVFGL